MKFLSWFILIVIVLAINLFNSLAQLEITEIMYNPPGSDNNKEFLEFFSDEDVNLSDFIIADSTSSDILVELQSFDSPYFLIVEEGFNYSNINASIYSVGATIGNNLGNSDDVITLFYPNESVVVFLNYSSNQGANGDGNSLQLIEKEWFASIPTPGNENKVGLNIEIETVGAIEAVGVEALGENIILSPYLDEVIYLGNEYTKLFKIKIKNKECSEKDEVTIFYNITNLDLGPNLVKQDQFIKEVGCSSYASTGEFIPAEPGNYTLCGKIISSTVNEVNENSLVCTSFKVIDTAIIDCDIAVNITGIGQENLLYTKGESVKFKPQLNNKTFPFTINYWIEDLFGNLVKKEVVTANTNQKSWKTKIEEEDRVLFIKAQVKPACNDFNESNNFAEKMFIVTNQENGDDQDDLEMSLTAIDEDSTIEIVKVTPTEVKFGGIVKAELEIYKGNTAKYSLSTWVEKGGKVVSEKTKFHLRDKNSQYKLTLPIQLQPNCDGKINDGKAEVVVEGLDLRVEEELSLVGIEKKLCETVTEEKVVKETKEDSVESSLSGTVFENPFPIKRDLSQSKGIVVYESNSTKAKNLIPYIMAITFGLLCLVLLKRF